MAARPCRARLRLGRRRLLGVRGSLPAAARRPLVARRRLLPQRRARRDEPEREPPVHARLGGARRPSGRRAAGRAGAGDRGAAVRGPALASRGDRPAGDRLRLGPDARLGLGRGGRLARAPARRDRRGGRPRPRAGLAGARHALARVARPRLDRRPALRDEPVLRVPRPAAQPDQLAARDLRVGGRRGRRPAAAAPRDPAAARPLRRRADARGPAVPHPVHRPGLPVPLRAGRPRRRPCQLRQPGVRDGGVRRPAVLRAGAARRHGAVVTAPAGRAARVGRARAVRLLDARGLPELGHRRQLPPLAPGDEVRPRPGGAAGHRGHAVAAAVARARPLGQVPARQRPGAVRPLVGRRDDAAAVGALRRHPHARRAGRRAAGGRADPGQRGARRRPRARRAALRGPAAAVLRTTRTSAGWR